MSLNLYLRILAGVPRNCFHSAQTVMSKDGSENAANGRNERITVYFEDRFELRDITNGPAQNPAANPSRRVSLAATYPLSGSSCDNFQMYCPEPKSI